MGANILPLLLAIGVLEDVALCWQRQMGPANRTPKFKVSCLVIGNFSLQGLPTRLRLTDWRL